MEVGGIDRFAGEMDWVGLGERNCEFENTEVQGGYLLLSSILTNFFFSGVS